MEEIRAWLGGLNALGLLGREMVGVVCIVASVLCGAVIGFERERRDKPAGLRTLILISVGSTIFTIVSLLLSQTKATADPARLAAQIIPGIGFLGAGAIIRARGAVRGLTTGATIWAVAAVGVTIGAGYVAAGIGFTVLILGTLTVMQRCERAIAGACRFGRVRLEYRSERGKTLPRLQSILDRYGVRDDVVTHSEHDDGNRRLEAKVCVRHREHRDVLRELAEIEPVLSLDVES